MGEMLPLRLIEFAATPEVIHSIEQRLYDPSSIGELSGTNYFATDSSCKKSCLDENLESFFPDMDGYDIVGRFRFIISDGIKEVVQRGTDVFLPLSVLQDQRTFKEEVVYHIKMFVGMQGDELYH